METGADGRPLRQVAAIYFQREGWRQAGKSFRVVATRYLDRDTGKQVQLWPDLEYAVQAFVTNNWQFDAADIVADYHAHPGLADGRRHRGQHGRVARDAVLAE